MGRSRGGFGTKLHLVTDGSGLPLGIDVTPGQSHESRSFTEALRAVPLRGAHGRIRPSRLAGDKGYSYGWIRAWLAIASFVTFGISGCAKTPPVPEDGTFGAVDAAR